MASSSVHSGITNARVTAARLSDMEPQLEEPPNPSPDSDQGDDDAMATGDDDSDMEGDMEFGVSATKIMPKTTLHSPKVVPPSTQRVATKTASKATAAEPQSLLNVVASSKDSGAASASQGKDTVTQGGLLSKATEHHEKMLTQYSPEKLWEGKIRQRAIDALSKATAQLSAKLTALPLPANQALHDKASQMMTDASAVGCRFDLFAKMKASPLEYVGTLSEVDKEILLHCDMSMISSILTQFGSET